MKELVILGQFEERVLGIQVETPQKHGDQFQFWESISS